MARRLVRSVLFFGCALLLSAVFPVRALACACGCGVFDVGTSAMLPTDAGGFGYLEVDSMDQKQNWSGARKASSGANDDQRLSSGFFTAGLHYMFGRAWGMMVELPYWTRSFKTAAGDGGSAGTFTDSSVGDIRLRGVYSGLSSDMSTGLTFGLKLPTGGFKNPHFDRDTAIGTGSTDALLGLYHVGRVPLGDAWNWFGNVQADAPMLTAGGYRPGAEGDAVAGAYYDRFRAAGVKLAPLAQVTGSWRGRDAGTFASDLGSGYERLLVGPGLEAELGSLRLYGDVGFPVYQRVIGNQLVAAQFYKVSVGYSF